MTLKTQIFTSILIFSHAHILPGLLNNTLIQTSSGPISIESISQSDSLLSLDIGTYTLSDSKVVQISRHVERYIYQITTPMTLYFAQVNSFSLIQFKKIGLAQKMYLYKILF